MTELPEPDETAPAVRHLGWLAGAALGAAAAVLALLPWLMTGMRLPLQNLWATPTSAQDMPVALLPFSQYAVTQIVGLVVVGYGIAGIAVRRARDRFPRRAVLAVGAGAVLVHAVAAAQSARTVSSGLADRTASTVYLVAVLAVVCAAVLVGLLALRLITAPPRAAAVLGLSLVALATGPWLTGLQTLPDAPPGEVPSAVLDVLVRWLPAVLVGAAIAWGGRLTRQRAAAALASLLLLWVVPAAFTAVTSAAGTRVLLPYPSELVGQALAVLRAALTAPDLVLPPLLAACAVAAAGLAGRRLLDRGPAPHQA